MRVLSTGFVRSAALAVVLGLAGAGHARADEALRHVQQSLRDQGFYYGPIDGSPGDETTQALRRYQIRNGLAVNGQLNDETRRSIERTGSSGGSSRPATSTADASIPPPLSTPSPPRRSPPMAHATPVPTPVPAPPAAASRARPSRPRPDADADADDEVRPAPRVPGNIRPDLRVDPDGGPSTGREYIPREGIAPSETLSAMFASTPFEFAPPPVQAQVLRRAKASLERNGFYDGRVDGAPGPATTEAILNFQEVNHLRRSGRLDVSTLGLMRLLPGRQTVGPRRDGDSRRGPDIIFQGRDVD